MTGDPLNRGVDILKVAEKFAPEVVYLRLRELEEEREALVEVARAARDIESRVVDGPAFDLGELFNSAGRLGAALARLDGAA